MFEFKFVDIGEGIHEGQILKWLVKVGDTVKDGTSLVVVETDKVNADLPSPVAGVVNKLGFKVGDNIKVGDTLVWIDETGKAPLAQEEVKQVSESIKEESTAVVGTLEISDEVIESAPEMNVIDETTSKVLATPVARKMASDLGVDLNHIQGSGEHGRIMKDDIISASHGQGVSTSKVVKEAIKMDHFNEGVTRVKISKLRKTIVNVMNNAHDFIVPTTLMDEYDITRLVKMRTEQKGIVEKQSIKLTYMAYIAKALAMTIKQFPLFNSSFDSVNEEIIFKNYINIGIAIDTPDGLIVPNIKNADQKTIIELAKEIEQLATMTKERTIQLEQLQNGTFSITNYGAIGTKFGTPVIKFPEVAILGVGTIYKRPIVNEHDEVVIAHMLPLSLTIDHRIIDGADGGRFLLKLKDYLTNPASMVLDLK